LNRSLQASCVLAMPEPITVAAVIAAVTAYGPKAVKGLQTTMKVMNRADHQAAELKKAKAQLATSLHVHSKALSFRMHSMLNRHELALENLSDMYHKIITKPGVTQQTKNLVGWEDKQLTALVEQLQSETDHLTSSMTAERRQMVLESDVSTCADSEALDQIGDMVFFGKCRCGCDFSACEEVWPGKLFSFSNVKGLCSKCNAQRFFTSYSHVEWHPTVQWSLTYRVDDVDDDNRVISSSQKPTRENPRSKGFRILDVGQVKDPNRPFARADFVVSQIDL